MDLHDLFLRTKEKHEKHDLMYKHYLDNLLYLSSMFEYSGFPENVDTTFIEPYLITFGGVGFGNINGTLTAFIPNRLGNINAYGLGDTLEGTTPVGDFTGIIGTDAVIGYNNSLRIPDFDAYTEASLMTEIDVSLKVGVINTRNTELLLARDKKSKTALETFCQNSFNGKPQVIGSANNFNFDESGEPVTKIDIHDIQPEKLQYLISLYEDRQRLFFRKYGHNMQTTGKRAQTSIEEIEGADSISFIIPIDRLRQREKMISEINRIFGTEASVKFSPTWEHEFNKYMESSNDEAFEPTGDDINLEGDEGNEDN